MTSDGLPDRVERNRENATRLWTCPLCGDEMVSVLRARHLLDHD